MSYSTASAQKFTLIDDLPDLDDLEAQGPRQQQNAVRNNLSREPHHDDKYNKFIRSAHPSSAESGMSRTNSQVGMSMNQPQPHSYEQYEEMPPQYKSFKLPPNTPSCLDVADHVANCPICSKFYNNDKTVYIIAIVVLLIIVMLLLKRILDV